MATKEQIYRASILINSEQAVNNIAKLKQQIADIKKRGEKAFSEGKLDVWKAANKEAAALEKKLQKQEKLAHGFSETIKNLSTAKSKELRELINQINKELDSPLIKKGSQQWNDYVAVLKDAKKELRELTEATQEHQSAFSRVTGFLNKNWGAITGLSTTVRGSVEAFATMDQEMYNVTKYTGWTIEQVRRMNEEFKQMDTRTSREELNQLAGAAGRLGITSEEGVKDFVDAADKINVALGDDLGKGAVDKIGKLAMAFGEDDRLGLRGAMLATGSAVNELAQNSAANAGYLVDFTARLSGVGQQAGLTQAQILGLGAAMDENMQRDEMAATALSQIITKMTTDSETFARIAGKNVEEFAQLVKTDMNQALMQFFEAMNKKGGFTELAPLFEQMGLDGTRAIGVLSTLAAKIGDVQRHQELATEAYRKQQSVLDEFNVQNQTYQARLEKARKAFNDLKVELGEKLLPVVQYTISGAGMLTKAIAAVIEFVGKNITAIAMLTATIAACTAAVEWHIVKQKVMDFWNKTLVKSFKLLFGTIMKHPYAALATAVAYVVGSFIDLRRETNSAATAQKAMAAASKKAEDAMADEQARVTMLKQQVEDNKLALDRRRQALQQLKDIIPGYNALLSEEGRLTQNNTSAIDEYLKKRKQELLLKAYEEETIEALKRQMKAYDALKKMIANYKNGGTWGTVQSKEFERVRQEAINANETLEQLNKAMEQAGRQLGTTLSGASTTGTTLSGASTTGSGTNGGDATNSTADKESPKNTDPLKKMEKELKDALQRQQTEALLSYRQGEITYQEYLDKLDELQKISFADRRKVFEDAYATERQEYWQLLKEESDYLDKQTEEDRKKRDSELQREKVLREANLRQQYNDIASEIYQDEEALNEALFRSEREYLQKRIENTKLGTQERMQLEQQLADIDKRHRLELAENYEKKLKQVRNSYAKMSVKEQMDAELEGLKALYESKMNQGRISEEQYQQMIQQIREKYASGVKDEQDKKIHKDDKKQSKGTSIADGVFNVFTIADNYKTEMEAIDQMLADHTITEQEAAEKRKQIWAESMEGIAAAASTAFNGINQMLSAASSYAQACSDLEVAKITANYDKQIEAAGNNSKKREKLEKERDEKIAAAKTKANKKAMSMEMAQAIAQTAMGAISAYSSTMSGAPYPANLVLAPISAGIALAAGALQIATIKKQHEAEAAGYYEGGFTGGTRYRKEAGVVHEGEFVANHQAVNNRQLMPVFSLIDLAQRNNRVASLRAEDVTNVMGGPASQVIAPIVNVQAPDNSELSGTLEKVCETQDRLAAQLEQGIGVDIPIDGENGVYRKIKKYENLLKNK